MFIHSRSQAKSRLLLLLVELFPVSHISASSTKITNLPRFCSFVTLYKAVNHLFEYVNYVWNTVYEQQYIQGVSAKMLRSIAVTLLKFQRNLVCAFLLITKVY